MTTDVFTLYCPLRNYLRKQKLNDSLLAIHSHIQFQQFHSPLPDYIRGEPVGYKNVTSFNELINFHVFPWELSILCKEVLLNSPKHGQTHTLLDWRYLSGAINKLKDLENEIAKLYSTKENVLLEMTLRIPHRQFRWQHVPTMDEPARYWKVFSYEKLRQLIENKIDLQLEDVIKIGMGLIGAFQNRIALFYPPKINIPGIDQTKLDKFLEHFCLGYSSLVEKIKSEQKYDNRFAYSYSSLIAYPLIRMDWDNKDALLCPIPRYLLERITNGLYYEICNSDGFDHAFGEAFQSYIGDTLNILYKNGKIYPEAKYMKAKRTADWLMVDQSAVAFIECKTKRLTFGAKIELFDLKELESEFDKMADAIVQTYKTIEDYKKGLYPQIKFNSSKKVYPIVVTLEDWFLYGDPLINMLDNLVSAKLSKNGLDNNLIDTNPYCAMSSETFESFLFIANKFDIKSVLEEKLVDKDKKYWEFENYLRKKYPEEIKQVGCPFVQELDNRINAMLAPSIS
jgi:hypothetical protein